MVNNATSYSGSGLRDWLVQRVSAVILAVYFVFLTVYLFLNHPLTYSAWTQLFSHQWMKIATLMTLASLALHAWVGVWTILTDYVKPYVLRIILEILVILALAALFFWGIIIFWSM